VSRIAYVNGRYVPHGQAAVHIDDRGYQFADGVYEVCGIKNGKLVDEDLHLERLRHSLDELRIIAPVGERALKAILRETVRRNRVSQGIVYFQISRGVAPRNHSFPKKPVPASLVVTARPNNPAALEELAQAGIAVVTRPDERWRHPHIKSLALLPNILAKQSASEAGAWEAWLVNADGEVTEGSSTNAWIVERDGTVVTHPANGRILNGIVRRVLIEAATAHQIRVEERAFRAEDLRNASEAFITASSLPLLPVVSIDGAPVGEGTPGPVARRLRDIVKSASRLT